jgi:hypothetical protein
MKYIIDEYQQLWLLADLQDREDILELRGEDQHFSLDDETEALERMLANSELQWINPEDTGDLTDCPILGVLGTETQLTPVGPYGAVAVGKDETGLLYQPIVARWGWVEYELRSFLEDLATLGWCRWTGGGSQALENSRDILSHRKG